MVRVHAQDCKDQGRVGMRECRQWAASIIDATCTIPPPKPDNRDDNVVPVDDRLPTHGPVASNCRLADVSHESSARDPRVGVASPGRVQFSFSTIGNRPTATTGSKANTILANTLNKRVSCTSPSIELRIFEWSRWLASPCWPGTGT